MYVRFPLSLQNVEDLLAERGIDDALNRVTSKLVPGGCAPIGSGPCPAAAATRSVYYDYDMGDRQLFARFDSATGAEGIANTYDDLGELTATTTTMGGVSRTLGYQYDLAGNRTQVTHPDGVAFGYTYDPAGRQTGNLFLGTHPSNAKAYDALGRLVGDMDAKVTFRYDPVGRLAGESIADLSNTGYAVSYGLSYNAASQIANQSRSNDLYGWADGVNVARTYQVNGLNQYTSAGPVTFGYDADGNLVTNATAAGTTTYGYDA